jgi:hypothetical protein
MMFLSNRLSALGPSEVERHWRRIAIASMAALALLAPAPLGLGNAVKAADILHFAVGPLQPTPGETKKAFDPFFKYLAERLGVTYPWRRRPTGRALRWR